ncbi:uncharacterized protein DSM5745_05813 [Aspergillus mulundensis]|uniref:Uncharacterized protein n=1 Tax=Aspergillus mulundensis TaxID=1810919 RepID=A0A3D8RYQ1_9EURO|nr:Uncharacterized protein DSM5745_05813 [Aspergillus mulundensis]RDW78961.1 Uncharacterized protein DSM5745_05813 [Aspergillus mulundensis]
MAPRRQTPIYKHMDAAGQLAITHVHNANQDLSLVDRLIEPQTIAHFLSFCCEGTLPNGKTTSLELLKGKELSLLEQKPETDESPFHFMDRIMSRIGSLEDDARMCVVGRNIWSVKNRLWAGMIPLSEQRWKEKGLDRPDNFDIAAQYLSAVVAVFEYLNRPRVQDNMRDTFNLISQHWGEFEAFVNSRREGRPVGIRKLWTEFIQAHFEVITERAHRWVLVHVNTLREPLIRDLTTYRPANLDEVDSVQWRLTDRLHILAEIAGVADYTIMLPMHGYYGYTTPPIPSGVLPTLRSPKWDVRNEAYGPYMKSLTRGQMIQQTLERREREGPRVHHVADPVEFQRTTRVQLGCQARARREIRGDPVEPVPKEPWIPDVMRSIKTETSRVGFVIYRLTYGQSEAEWSAFREKFEAHVSDWGRGQTGSAVLKPHLMLEWRDGKELGIPEGGIEAAKKHYLDTYPDSEGEDVESPQPPEDSESSDSDSSTPLTLISSINRRAFLAVDLASYTSYTSKTYTPCSPDIPPGDFTGFILAIDPDFDPAEGPDRPDETPGFFGQLRVLGSLLWGDLFGMLASQCAILEDLWPLALDHPDNVYAGPLVPLVTKAWRVHNGIRGVLMNEMMGYVRARLEGRVWPSSSASATATSTAQQADTTTNTNTATGTGSSTSSAPPPPLDSDQTSLRIWMMFQYARSLRGRGQTRQAIIVESMIRAPRGAMPDMADVARRMELEGIPVSAGELEREVHAMGRDQGCPMQ